MRLCKRVGNNDTHGNTPTEEILNTIPEIMRPFYRKDEGTQAAVFHLDDNYPKIIRFRLNGSDVLFAY